MSDNNIISAKTIPGSDKKVNWNGYKHKLPPHKHIKLKHGLSPEEAQGRKDAVGSANAELNELRHKDGKLTRAEKRRMRELEGTIAINDDLLHADAEWDTKQAENGHPEYVEGKLDYFEMTDELRNIGNISYPI